MDFLEATPLDVLERDRSYLPQLTLHEEMEEQRLLREVVDFYWSVRQRRKFQREDAAPATVGGFEKSWTLAGSAAS